MICFDGFVTVSLILWCILVQKSEPVQTEVAGGSILECSGGIDKSLGLVNRDTVCLSIAGTKVELLYTDGWHLGSIEPGELNVDINIVQDFLGFGKI